MELHLDVFLNAAEFFHNYSDLHPKIAFKLKLFLPALAFLTKDIYLFFLFGLAWIDLDLIRYFQIPLRIETTKFMKSRYLSINKFMARSFLPFS